MAKESEAQKRASEKWNAENRRHRTFLTSRSGARGFIRDSKGNNAKEPTYIDDLINLRQMIDDKLKK